MARRREMKTLFSNHRGVVRLPRHEIVYDCVLKHMVGSDPEEARLMIESGIDGHLPWGVYQIEYKLYSRKDRTSVMVNLKPEKKGVITDVYTMSFRKSEILRVVKYTLEGILLKHSLAYAWE